MRTENEMMSLILQVARTDDRIRAVLLTGSRANPNARNDRFSDYEIIYVVRGIETFLSDHQWIDVFGRRLILQMPQIMHPGISDEDRGVGFTYLMLFNDGNRIDLTLFPHEKIKEKFNPDSLTVLLMDKDNLIPGLPAPNEADFLIRAPDEKEFLDCCNEFWWVSTYVAKGIWRLEIPYAKDMLEKPVRSMFFKMIEWHIGANRNFSVSAGKSGKYISQLVSPTLWTRIQKTYPDAEPENIWTSLFLMIEIFRELATGIAGNFHFNYNTQEDEKVSQYLKEVRASV